MADKNPLFAAKPDDPKDVAWGLTTADTCWRRGERSEALRWLRRAVESASEAEADERALELAKIAADLATQIGSMIPPPAVPPPAPSSAPAPLNPQSAAPKEATTPIAPRAAPLHPLIVPKTGGPKGPSPARAPAAKEGGRKSDRKSITNEATPKRAAQVDGDVPHDKTSNDLTPAPSSKDTPPRKRSASRADKEEAKRRTSRTDEIDAWPTEVLAADAVPASLGLDDMAEKARVAAAVASMHVRASQAVRVLAWRAADGSVRVASEADPSAALEDTIEVTVTALDPSDDLVALFSPRS